MKRLFALGLIISFLTISVGCKSQQEKEHNESVNISTENKLINDEVINNEVKEESKVEEAGETIPIYKDVSTNEAQELMDSTEELVILDVRTKREYNAGHLKNAINISHDEVEKRIGEIEEYKNIPILLYCRTGRRSEIVLDILKKNDFNIVYHMHEGISAWKNEVEK